MLRAVCWALSFLILCQAYVNAGLCGSSGADTTAMCCYDDENEKPLFSLVIPASVKGVFAGEGGRVLIMNILSETGPDETSGVRVQAYSTENGLLRDVMNIKRY